MQLGCLGYSFFLCVWVLWGRGVYLAWVSEDMQLGCLGIHTYAAGLSGIGGFMYLGSLGAGGGGISSLGVRRYAAGLSWDPYICS